MKNKWFIIIVSLALGIALIGVGFMLKWQEGYSFETKEQLKSAISDLKKVPIDQVNLLSYQKEEHGYYIIVGKVPSENFVYIFKETANHRYKEYYSYLVDTFDDHCLTIRDSHSNLLFLIVKDTYHRVAKVQPIGRRGDLKAKVISSEDEYIMKAFENNDDYIMSVVLHGTEGEYLDNYSYEEVSLE